MYFLLLLRRFHFAINMRFYCVLCWFRAVFTNHRNIVSLNIFCEKCTFYALYRCMYVWATSRGSSILEILCSLICVNERLTYTQKGRLSHSKINRRCNAKKRKKKQIRTATFWLKTHRHNNAHEHIPTWLGGELSSYDFFFSFFLFFYFVSLDMRAIYILSRGIDIFHCLLMIFGSFCPTLFFSGSFFCFFFFFKYYFVYPRFICIVHPIEWFFGGRILNIICAQNFPHWSA